MPFLTLIVLGDVQDAKVPLSSAHSKLEPASEELKEKLAFLFCFLFTLSIFVCGAVVSGTTASSLTIVATPWPSAIVALPGVDRSTASVSSGSPTASPVTATLTVFAVWPGVKVSVPAVAA